MDSERLKDERDGLEMVKISKLRELHHRTMCIIRLPEAAITTRPKYEKLLKFIDNNVMNKPLSINFLEFSKFAMYMMLKYSCEAIIDAAHRYEEDMSYKIPIQTASDLMSEIEDVNKNLFSLVYETTNDTDIGNPLFCKELLMKYCSVMYKICYVTDSFSKDDIDFNLKRVCFLCHIQSIYCGIGRLEAVCEDIPIKTYTSFQNIVYNGCCSHFIAPLDKYTTQYDMLLSSR